MKKNLFSTLLALLTVGAMLTCVGCKNYDDDISQINTKIASLESATAQISTLESKVTSLESSVATLSSTVSSMKSSTEANTADIEALEKSVASMNSAIDAAKSDIADLKAAVKAQISAEEVQKMIDKANAELTQKVNEALVQVADMKIVIDALPETVKAQVDAAVASIKDALGAVSGQIQSIVYLPTDGTYDNPQTISSHYYNLKDSYYNYGESLYAYDYTLSATYEIYPAELAQSITKDQVKISLLFSLNGLTYRVSVNPDEVEAGNGFLTWYYNYEDSAIAEYISAFYSISGDGDCYINTAVSQPNVIDGVDYGTYISSGYLTLDGNVSTVYPIFYNGEDIYAYYNGGIQNDVAWSAYKTDSKKAVFGDYAPAYIVYNYENAVKGILTPAEAAELFGMDEKAMTPVPASRSIEGVGSTDLNNYKEGGSAFATTIQINTDKVKKDDAAKALVNDQVAVTLNDFEVLYNGVKKPISYFYCYEMGFSRPYAYTSGITAYYNVTNEESGTTAKIQDAKAVWNYYSNAFEYEELTISADIFKDASEYGIESVVNSEGGNVWFQSYGFSRRSSDKVWAYIRIADFPEHGSDVFTVNGYTVKDAVKYPFTWNITVSPRPEDYTTVDLTVKASAGTEVAFAPIAASFGGNEKFYLGETGNTAEALYASLANGSLIDNNSLDKDLTYTQTIDPSNIEVKDPEGVIVADVVNSVTLKYVYNSTKKVWEDKSTIDLAAELEYGDSYSVSVAVGAPWARTFVYSIALSRDKADATLVPTGFVKDGVVSMGGSLVNNIYTINQMTFLKYVKLNAGTSNYADFKVGFEFTTEAGVAFGDNAKNTKLGCVGKLSNWPNLKYSFDEDGNIDFGEVITEWGDYKGLYFNVSAQLYNSNTGDKYGDPLKFKVETAEPIQSVDYSAAINETISANTAANIWLYQNTKVYGVLDPTKNLVFYNPSVEGTAGYPWATTKLAADGKTVVLDNTLGNKFYNQLFAFDSEDAKVYVNGVEGNFADVAEVDGYQLKIKAQSAKGTYKFEIPAKLVFMLDHNHVNAKTGTVTVNVVVE